MSFAVITVIASIAVIVQLNNIFRYFLLERTRSKKKQEKVSFFPEKYKFILFQKNTKFINVIYLLILTVVKTRAMQRALEALKAEQKLLALKKKFQIRECYVELNTMLLNGWNEPAEPAIAEHAEQQDNSAQQELPTTANEMVGFCTELKEKSK